MNDLNNNRKSCATCVYTDEKHTNEPRASCISSGTDYSEYIEEPPLRRRMKWMKQNILGGLDHVRR